ncbi:hypothetical protein RI129_010697 [Pyrocoelia pectoralis]|uniref:SHSP domain-containing protein n=1 Tax=Pyrocoelia pectoralis TaxID=417401 RepID=A0AAN7V7F4_9COLE
MSLLPLIFRDMVRPLRMIEHQMRMAEEFFPTVVYPMIRNGTTDKFFVETCDGKESVIQDGDKFQVKLDVKNFTPEEITVKAIDESAIVIEAKHEKNDENGSVSRQLFRKFLIPKGHDMKRVESVFSSDGILTITAPNKVEKVEERTIPITHINTNEEKN